jgi:hypothetical protein
MIDSSKIQPIQQTRQQGPAGSMDFSSNKDPPLTTVRLAHVCGSLPWLVTYISLVIVIHIQACKSAPDGQENKDHNANLWQGWAAGGL